MAFRTPCRNVLTKCDKKEEKEGMLVTELLIIENRESIKHLLKISCKNKVLIKSYSARNERNELLGHPVYGLS